MKSAIKSLNRRQFLRRAAKTAGAALAFPSIITSNALGGQGGVPASERIVFGTIGIGNRGSSDLSWLMQSDEVVVIAHCCLNRTRREATKRTIDTKYNSDIDTYIDFRDLLARQDIDAVLSTTGDRNHAMCATYAMRAGKDVYSEKPGCLTIQEGQVLEDAQRRYGRVYQGGAQRLNESNYIFANECARLGLLGEVKTYVAELVGDQSVYMRTEWLPAQEEPPKEEFWWDEWLGVCPWRPYNSSYQGWGWIGWHDFYNGKIGEWGSHTVVQAMDAMETLHTAPSYFEYTGSPDPEGLRMIFADGREIKLESNMGTCAVRYEGSEYTISSADSMSGDSKNRVLFSKYDKVVNDYRERTGRTGDHMDDFISCIKTRRQTACPAQAVHRSMSAVQGSNICMWLKRDVQWDPEKEEFINDESANRLRSRAQRQPWAYA